MKTRVVRMARKPAGVPEPDDFSFAEVALPEPREGEALVRIEAISLDPYIRLRMAGRHLIGNLLPGDAISSEMVGTVMRSRTPALRDGQTVAGFAPWSEQAVLPAAELRPIDFGDLPVTLAFGVLGMPGLTAYAGVTQLLEIGPDDVLVVSAASGPVGATVGQLARERGARVIGIAGGPEKCGWAVEQAGFMACIDYRAQDVAAEVRRLIPEGPTAYFDNVGGDLLRTMLRAMRPYGRIAICGIMADYNEAQPAPGPLPLEIIQSRATIKGLVVYDFEHLRDEMIAEHRRLIAAGKLAWWEDVAVGLENAPAAFARLMRGENHGKAVLRVQ